MLTAALVVKAPALSVARTVSTWFPTETFLQMYEYGAVVSWPSTVVPSRNSTLVTCPSLSVAVAAIVIVGFQAKLAPSAGNVIAAAGGVFVLAVTVIVAGAARRPSSSTNRR